MSTPWAWRSPPTSSAATPCRRRRRASNLRRKSFRRGRRVSHFRALFGRSFGQPPHRYVIERRLARARVLIEADAAPLAEVALMAGFSHQSHLARWMRRLEGVTPGELRRKL